MRGRKQPPVTEGFPPPSKNRWSQELALNDRRDEFDAAYKIGGVTSADFALAAKNDQEAVKKVQKARLKLRQVLNVVGSKADQQINRSYSLFCGSYIFPLAFYFRSTYPFPLGDALRKMATRSSLKDFALIGEQREIHRCIWLVVAGLEARGFQGARVALRQWEASTIESLKRGPCDDPEYVYAEDAYGYPQPVQDHRFMALKRSWRIPVKVATS